MSDPVEVAQQAQTIANSAPVNHAGWAILGGIVRKKILRALGLQDCVFAAGGAAYGPALTDVVEIGRAHV